MQLRNIFILKIRLLGLNCFYCCFFQIRKVRAGHTEDKCVCYLVLSYLVGYMIEGYALTREDQRTPLGSSAL